MLRSTSTAILLFLLGGAIFAPTTFAASIETYSNVLNSEEIDYFAAVDVNVDANLDEEGGGEGVCNRANKYFGAAVLDPAISSRIHDVTGTPVTAEEQRQYRRSIAVTKIMGDTEPHVDYHYSNADSIGTEAVEDKVAFIFLETNSDAKFVLGTTEIPAEAGKLVAFDGNLRHSTKVPRGTLSIAGPFHLRTLSFVGPCDENAECELNEICQCCDIRRRLTTTDKDGNNDQQGQRELGELPSCGFGRRLMTDDKNEQQGQRKLGKRRALEELNEIHEREISTEEENKNFDERGPDGDADSSNRRRLAECFAGQCVPNTGKSDKASSPKSSKAPKGSKGSKGTQ
eukprot:CAMPEP_0185812438 /NCGR_PEP_ID=MMETSP1322-20130828/9342_1 /TAXON_ID=265543 /ORGANISM="Minutocellus polymorphus, Strain RCC2270" /LENGTH=342 /DNA_ID=CAMNT_0028508975 /DNA_START=129 /DNA_END=1157 /DNA_ORIENTATION=+